MDIMKIYSPVCNMKAIVLKPISLLVKTSKRKCFGETNLPGVVRKRFIFLDSRDFNFRFWTSTI